MHCLFHRTPAALRIPSTGLRRGLVALGVLLLATACAPEVGSARWCETIREKGLGNITPNEAADYARHCVLQ